MTLLAQVGEMARRSITQTLRQPALLVPPILFPLCLLAVNVGGLDPALIDANSAPCMNGIAIAKLR